MTRSCVKPTSDCTAPPASISVALQHRDELSRHDEVETPIQWASRAWTAVERSLLRCPAPLGCISPSSPDHNEWLESRAEFVSVYAKRLEEGSAIKWLKFHTSYCFGYAWDQAELPPVPGPLLDHEKPGRFVGKRLSKALQLVMARGRSGNGPARRCALDILMSKLGFPPAPPTFVEAALRDHEKAVCHSRPELDAEGKERRKEVERQIFDICQTVYGHVTFHHRDLLPSLRASFCGRLMFGGALGELFRGFEEFCPEVNLKDGIFYRLVRGPELVSMGFTPSSGVSQVRLPYVDDIVESFQNYVDLRWLERVDEPLDAIPIPILEPLKVRTITKGQEAEYYRTLELQKLLHGALRKHPVFQYVGQPISDAAFGECFGCRDDLGPSEFYVSGDYKAATDNLDPALSEFAWTCICRCVRVSWEGQMVRLVDTPYYHLGLKGLTGHRLWYSKHSTRRERDQLDEDVFHGLLTEDQRNKLSHDVHFQQWGQLMGSPMSFPILCIVNCAATLAAKGECFRPDTKIRINGDDIAFISDQQHYDQWKLVTKECGLEFSMGKNYCSRDFLIMNSELRRPPTKKWEATWEATGYLTSYERTVASTQPASSLSIVDRTLGLLGEEDGKRVDVLSLNPCTHTEWYPEEEVVVRPASWILEGYMNQCLLYHTVRKGMEAGSEKDVYWTDLGDLSEQILRGIPESQQSRILDAFLKAHQSVIREMPPLVNLWFPRPLGGAGVKLPTGSDLKKLVETGRDPDIVLKQRKLAAYLACSPEVRARAPVTPKGLVGPISAEFKEIRQLSDSWAPPKLVKRVTGMFPGQRAALEGSTLLGLTLLYVNPPETDNPHANGDCESESLTARHRPLSALLNQRYRNWTRNGLEHRLSEISYEKLSNYRECYDLVSYVDRMGGCTVRRLLDQPLNVAGRNYLYT